MSGCGTHNYEGFTQTKIDAVLKALQDNGAGVSGNNPWDVDTHQHGVKLRAAWSPESGQLSVTITDKAWYAPCGKVWEKIDDLLNHVQQVPDAVAALHAA